MVVTEFLEFSKSRLNPKVVRLLERVHISQQIYSSTWYNGFSLLSLVWYLYKEVGGKTRGSDGNVLRTTTGSRRQTGTTSGNQTVFRILSWFIEFA